jgi:hypothetical protein
MLTDMKKFISKYDNRTFIINEDFPGIGFYIYAYDRDGKNTHDYLQDDLDMAKLCALDEFGVPADSWTEVQTANYTDIGFADSMGPKLKKLVEDMLIADLKHYHIDNEKLKFDWSQSCIEGKSTKYLDGSLDRYSGIAVFDNQDNLVADGWMEFIHENDFFIVFWDTVTTIDPYKSFKTLADKKIGIPKHIWTQIPADIKPKYINQRQ